MEQEIKSKGGIFKLVTPPSRIGNNRDDIDNDQIIAEANRNDEDESS